MTLWYWHIHSVKKHIYNNNKLHANCNLYRIYMQTGHARHIFMLYWIWIQIEMCRVNSNKLLWFDFFFLSSFLPMIWIFIRVYISSVLFSYQIKSCWQKETGFIYFTYPYSCLFVCLFLLLLFFHSLSSHQSRTFLHLFQFYSISLYCI